MTAGQPLYPVLSSQTARPVRAPHIRSILERRLGEFIGGQYGKYNLSSFLFEGNTDEKPYVSLEKWSPEPGEKPTFEEAKRQKYTEAKKGDRFGPSWTNHWIRLNLTVPKEWRDKEMVQLECDPSCEAMVWDETGLPLQGLTGGFGADRRVDFPLPKSMRNGVTLYIEVSANGMFGVPSDHTGDPDPNRYFTLLSADIVVKRPEAWGLLWDFEALRGCVREMPQDGPLQNKAGYVANEIMNTFRHNDVSSISRCRKLAEEVLGKDWESKGADVYKDGQIPGREDTVIWALGHSHIDTAWLWPYSVTQQKVARSWSTQLALMDRFPEHRFTASTAQQMSWLETLYPRLFEKVQHYAHKGTFQPIGGSWVECDANMPSGEAFVRQFVYGQRFFETRFGKRSDVFWLPDTFGYNAQIPQLARSAGLEYFFTQKLSWNNINKFPHNSFMWTGLDGTQIITHMTPVDNYDSQCGVDDILRGVKNNRNLDVQPTALLLFGFGDGGGGPTEVMLQNLRRARAITNAGHVEMPKVTTGQSAREFFDHLRTTTKEGARLPTWQGEIYLEFHRGVYTSHGSIKKGNRRSEILMHNLEWAATLASLSKGAEYSYPKEEIDKLWEHVLLNQFHDVLPGSSIRKVYDDAERIYRDIKEKGGKLLRMAVDALGSDARNEGGIMALNTLGIPRRELVRVPSSDATSSDGPDADLVRANAVQTCEDGTHLLLLEDVLASGSARSTSGLQTMRSLEAVCVTQTGHNAYTMRNAFIAVTVEKGRITSINDHASRREVLAKGRTAGLTICEDYPPTFDAWETETYSLDTMEEIPFEEVRITERGPWRASLALVARFGNSTAQITISLDSLPATVPAKERNARSMLRFDTEIDWQEKHRFLRFQVPTALRADDALFETQFGVTKRPTTRNTTWETAKFEVCGHRFADLSEANYGLALLSDSKYGYSVEGGDMRLSLLKAATSPDAHQDEGKHTFAFALYPHPNAFVDSDVVQAARIFNDPLVGAPGGVESRATACITLEGASSVVLDTIKRAEQDFGYQGVQSKGTRAVVCRLYESIGGHASVQLKTTLPISRIAFCNILEDDLPVNDKANNVNNDDTNQLQLRTSYNLETGEEETRVRVDLRGFEVVTLKLVLKS